MSKMPRHRNGLRQANRTKLKRTKQALESRRLRDAQPPLPTGHIDNVRITRGVTRYGGWPVIPTKPSFWQRVTYYVRGKMTHIKQKLGHFFGRSRFPHYEE